MNEYRKSRRRKRDIAHKRVKRAIDRGDLVRPDVCSRCGKKPGRTKDGRPMIQGHHHDYDKPLDVEWICPMCHKTERPKSTPPGIFNGENNGMTKLTAEKVIAIRKSTAIATELARQYGVDPETIRMIRRRETWNHI